MPEIEVPVQAEVLSPASVRRTGQSPVPSDKVVAVIGAGITGCMIAAELAKLDVTQSALRQTAAAHRRVVTEMSTLQALLTSAAALKKLDEGTKQQLEQAYSNTQEPQPTGDKVYNGFTPLISEMLRHLTVLARQKSHGQSLEELRDSLPAFIAEEEAKTDAAEQRAATMRLGESDRPPKVLLFDASSLIMQGTTKAAQALRLNLGPHFVAGGMDTMVPMLEHGISFMRRFPDCVYKDAPAYSQQRSCRYIVRSDGVVELDEVARRFTALAEHYREAYAKDESLAELFCHPDDFMRELERQEWDISLQADEKIVAVYDFREPLINTSKLTAEMRSELAKHRNIRNHFSSFVTGVQKKDGGYEITYIKLDPTQQPGDLTADEWASKPKHIAQVTHIVNAAMHGANAIRNMLALPKLNAVDRVKALVRVPVKDGAKWAKPNCVMVPGAFAAVASRMDEKGKQVLCISAEKKTNIVYGVAAGPGSFVSKYLDALPPVDEMNALMRAILTEAERYYPGLSEVINIENARVFYGDTQTLGTNIDARTHSGVIKGELPTYVEARGMKVSWAPEVARMVVDYLCNPEITAIPDDLLAPDDFEAELRSRQSVMPGRFADPQDSFFANTQQFFVSSLPPKRSQSAQEHVVPSDDDVAALTNRKRSQTLGSSLATFTS
ncbi:MAG: hypothetical protein DHS20C10_01800 [marine bacterium B5-7]|nr:MAG: hypothetical protein DHS20C10_01800 [marine bacterium B5-7]